MEISRHTLISKIKESTNYFIINSLSGNADIVDKKTAQAILKGTYTDIDELVQKGYYCNHIEEEKIYRKKYLDFVDSRDSDEIQIFFVPWYSCNFSCSYCFQDEYTNPSQIADSNVIEAFFNYVENEFAGRKKYITIFGGEPLLTGLKQRNIIEQLLEKSKQANLDVAIVTNGYHLSEYVDLLSNYSIREVQVTVDGIEKIHNSRRIHKNRIPTFDKIVEGIDACLEAKIPINLRMVVDRENINELPKLANFAISKKWTKNPLFKTQLGRNYELHHCQVDNNKLYSRISMYEDIYDLLKKYPEISEFHKPAFSISKFLFEKGELPDPLFDSCPGTKTEWAFDYTGAIYSCTATVGKTGEQLGTFYPEIHKATDIIDTWQERDILSIDKCKECNVSLLCGGGCASVAKNESNQILSPDCRPIKELLELGIAHYFNQ